MTLDLSREASRFFSGRRMVLFQAGCIDACRDRYPLKSAHYLHASVYLTIHACILTHPSSRTSMIETPPTSLHVYVHVYTYHICICRCMHGYGAMSRHGCMCLCAYRYILLVGKLLAPGDACRLKPLNQPTGKCRKPQVRVCNGCGLKGRALRRKQRDTAGGSP